MTNLQQAGCGRLSWRGPASSASHILSNACPTLCMVHGLTCLACAWAFIAVPHLVAARPILQAGQGMHTAALSQPCELRQKPPPQLL